MYTMWNVAGMWYEIVAVVFYTTETQAAHEGIGILLIAYMVLGLFMAYLYPRFFKGGRPAIEGLKFGTLIGLLWVFPHELAMVGAHGASLSYVFKNAAWHAVVQGLGGIVIGLIYSRQPQ